MALATRFDVNGLDLLATSLEQMLEKSRPTAVNKEVAETLLSRVEEAIAAEDFNTAERLGELALNAARKAKDAAVLKAAVERGKSLTTQKQQWQLVQDAKGELAKTPDDPAANQTLGKHLCFVQADWATGLPLLAKGGDATLAELAKQSPANPSDVDGLVALGDAWWTKAEAAKGVAKAELQSGARHWYTQAQPAATGLTKVKIDQRLKQLGAEAHPLGPRPAKG